MPNLLVGRYKRIGEIGRGGFGMVEEFLDLITGDTVAIKTIPPYFVQRESKRMIREVDIMKFLHNTHPHVIDLIAIFITRCQGSVTAQISNPEPYPPNLDVMGPLYKGLSVNEKAIMHHDNLAKVISTIHKEESFSLHIVMPLMRGDLFYFINLLSSSSGQKQHRLSGDFLKQVAAVFAFQLVFGLDWVHKCGIVHRDLKPDNVLVRLNTENPFYSSLCIADFGLARNVQSSDTFYVCTRNYRPPEIITSAILSQLSMDIWSLGCILYEMCTGETLFKMPTALDSHGLWNGMMASSQLEIILSIVGTPSEEDILQYMPEGNAKTYLLRSMSRPSQLEKLMDQQWTLPTLPEETRLWRNLIKKCLAFFPQQRPTAEELSRHELFIRYQMIVGRNIHQIETQLYTPSIAESELKSRTAQISSLLRIIYDTMVQTRPTLVEEEEEEEESEEESFVEEEDYNNRKEWDGIRHHGLSTPAQASVIDDLKGSREEEKEEDDEDSGTVYFKRSWLSNEPAEQLPYAFDEGANYQSCETMQPLELPEATLQMDCAETMEHKPVQIHGVGHVPVVENDLVKKPPKLTAPFDPSLQWCVAPQDEIPQQGRRAGPSMEGNRLNDYEGVVGMEGGGGREIPPQEGVHYEGGGRGLGDPHYGHGEVGWEVPRPSSRQGNSAEALRRQENRVEEMCPISFSTSAHLLQRNDAVSVHYDPENCECPAWSGYLHEHPYQNNMHVYNTKPYAPHSKNSLLGRGLHGERRGGGDSKNHRMGVSRTGCKKVFQDHAESAPYSPKGAPIQHYPPMKPKKQERMGRGGGSGSGKSQYRLVSSSCYDASGARSSAAQPHLNKQIMKTIPFPEIHDPALCARYGNLDHTDDTLQLAIESILDELNSNRRDMTISLELRTLLSYFCTLRGSR